jgi:hypothetical protein
MRRSSRAARHCRAGAPDPGRAVALAKRILLAWADRGLPRDAHGGFRSVEALSCEANGKLDQISPGYVPLHLGRGVIYFGSRPGSAGKRRD